MTEDAIRSFYNETFFHQGRAQKAKLAISLKTEEREIVIPGIEVGPNSTIDEIVRSFHAFVVQNGPVPLKEKTADDKPELINFEVMQYRGNRYYVEEYPEAHFIVRRENGQPLKEKSPNALKLIKDYKEQFWPKPTE